MFVVRSQTKRAIFKLKGTIGLKHAGGLALAYQRHIKLNFHKKIPYGGFSKIRSHMKSAVGQGEVVEKYLGEEQEAQRVLGPFKHSLFPWVHVSPFGVIPKADLGKWRLILDLFSPHGSSVNDGIVKELCSLSCMMVDDIASRVLKLGRGALVAKFDLKAV